MSKEAGTALLGGSAMVNPHALDVTRGHGVVLCPCSPVGCSVSSTGYVPDSLSAVDAYVISPISPEHAGTDSPSVWKSRRVRSVNTADKTRASVFIGGS